MPSSIPEKDWKVFRALKDELLSSACEAVFQRVAQVAADREGREHERYLQLWSLIRDENDAIAQMFDNPSRSNAFLQIMTMRSHGVLTEKHMALFSQETQERLKVSDA